MHLISICWDFPCLDDHTRCVYINNREQLIKFIWIDNGLTNRHDVTSKNACCKDCQGMLRERVKKKMEIVIPTFLRLHLSFLCASLSAFYTRIKKKKLLRQTMFYDPLWKTEFLKLDGSVPMICVNDTIQIDIRRFYSG